MTHGTHLSFIVWPCSVVISMIAPVLEATVGGTRALWISRCVCSKVLVTKKCVDAIEHLPTLTSADLLLHTLASVDLLHLHNLTSVELLSLSLSLFLPIFSLHRKSHFFATSYSIPIV